MTSKPMTIAEALHQATLHLAALHDTARLDAETLLAFTLERNRSHLHAWPDRRLQPEQQTRFNALIERRAMGEPVAYLTGHREFWSMELEVTPATLIPRPETELLVELVLQRIPPGAAGCIADLGTGSGAIALAIASERPTCRIIATDRSAAALEVARRNAAALAIKNIEFREGDWLAPLAGAAFHLIVSNPPYVSSHDPRLNSTEIRFEPLSALASGPDGLDDIRLIAGRARQHILPGGWLLLEHGYDQGEVASQILTGLGYQQVSNHQDMAGVNRAVSGQWHGSRQESKVG